jgi:hypothetical protein
MIEMDGERVWYMRERRERRERGEGRRRRRTPCE